MPRPYDGMKMRAFVPGIYARSEALIQATRDLDRGRTTAEAVDEQFERDRRELVAVQEDAGLDLLSAGLLRWQDLFRPLAEAAEGLSARPLVRFLDTNTFFRAVLVDGKPRLRQPLPAPELPKGSWLATLPSPLAFARATDGALDARTLAAEVLAPQIEAYAAGGCALIVLSEPFLAGWERGEDLAAALEELPKVLPLALWLPFSDASPVLEKLAEAPVSAVGIDFYLTPLDALPQDYPKEIMAGVIDSRSSRVEDPADIREFVEQLLQRNSAGISLTQNGDLQFVSEPIAREKIARLAGARTPLEEAA
jgi:5-methyltetrahydropteroyltriglutamate--homocysteine methyltransferase